MFVIELSYLAGSIFRHYQISSTKSRRKKENVIANSKDADGMGWHTVHENLLGKGWDRIGLRWFHMGWDSLGYDTSSQVIILVMCV